MTDAQWHCIHSFLITCPDIRVGHEDHCRLLWKRRAGWHGGALLGVSGRPSTAIELGLSLLCPRVRPGRLAAPDGLPAGRTGSVREIAGQHGRARARERSGRAPKQRAGSRPRSQPGRLQHPDPHPSGSPRPSPAPARDGRPAPRQPLGPGPSGSLDGRAAALPDRRPGL